MVDTPKSTSICSLNTSAKLLSANFWDRGKLQYIREEVYTSLLPNQQQQHHRGERNNYIQLLQQFWKTTL